MAQFTPKPKRRKASYRSAVTDEATESEQTRGNDMDDKIKQDATIEILIHPEDLPVRGNLMASGDDVLDKQFEDAVIEELEHNPWAWCVVEVKASWKGLKASTFLGGCSYRSEADFKVDGYFDDMVDEVIKELNQNANEIKAELE